MVLRRMHSAISIYSGERSTPLFSLQVASSNYHAHISQKVVTDGVRGEDKLMHDEALGVVMANYGEELGDDSEFGAPRDYI